MTQLNPNPTLSFELTLEEANLVLAALQELPAKVCNPLSSKIKSQAELQIAELQKAAGIQSNPQAELPLVDVAE